MERKTENYILRSIPDEEFESLRPHLVEVSLQVGDVINYPYDPIPNVYFPNDAMVSVIASTPEGQLSEAGVVGREGMVGIGIVLGVDTTPHENAIQLPGTALQMSAGAIREKFESCPELRKRLLHFTHAHMMQLIQTALCNRLHLLEQRLARWILLAHDRSSSDVLPLTQEFLAIMLGVQRPTVSHAAQKFKTEGSIKYNRGIVTVLDRKAIEKACCDCYEVVKAEFDRVLK
jgi:CRP-like cAMP-binding protein